MFSPQRLLLPAALGPFLGAVLGAVLGCGGGEPAPTASGPFGDGPAASLVHPEGEDLGPRAILEIPAGSPTVSVRT